MPARLDDRVGRYMSAGMTLAACIGLFGYGGYLLDDLLGTIPLFLLLGLFAGLFGGSIHLLNLVAPEMLPFTKKDRNGPAREPGDEPRDPGGTDRDDSDP